MRLISIIFFSLLFSCNSSVEETEKPILDPSLENPWTYINRISDTLSETEFSLHNTVEENLEIFKKFNSNKAFTKYRIGQNRNIPVMAMSVQDYSAVCIMYDYSPICIQQNHSNEYLIDDEFYGELSPSLSDTIFNEIIEFMIDSDYSINHIPIIVDFSIGLKQESILEMYDMVAAGYLKFLNLVSKNKHKIPFVKLNEKLQNVIIKDYPLMLEYDFYRLMNRPNFLRLPK